jgi:hypothetical protein
MRTVREVRPRMDGFLRFGRLEGYSDERPDTQAMTPKRPKDPNLAAQADLSAAPETSKYAQPRLRKNPAPNSHRLVGPYGYEGTGKAYH